MKSIYILAAVQVFIFSCSGPEHYDVILRNGSILDGSGGPAYIGDVGINADTIAAIGDLKDATGKLELDVSGKAVSPGFINMLSWAPYTLIVDGKSQSDIRQGGYLRGFWGGQFAWAAK